MSEARTTERILSEKSTGACLPLNVLFVGRRFPGTHDTVQKGNFLYAAVPKILAFALWNALN